jgi:hypothetical protein
VAISIVHFPRQKNRESDKKGLWFQERKNNFCSHCGKSGNQIKKCWTPHSDLCSKQNQEYVKEIRRRQVTTSMEFDSLAKRFEK